MSCRLLIAPVALVLLTGCATVDPVTRSADPGFGEAVKYNAAVQTINPAPIYDETGEQPGGSGAKAVGAVERYRTDQVKEVEMEGTTTSTGGGTGPS